MNRNRIKELQYFADDFNDKLQLAVKRHCESRNTCLEKEKEKERISSLSPSNANRNKKPLFASDIFKTKPHWRPNSLNNDYFNDLKLLKLEHNLSAWEATRIHLVKRSYEKESNMLNGKNFICRDLSSKDFTEHEKDSKSNLALSPLGEKIINQFKKDNQQREEYFKMKEKELWDIKHSRQSVELKKDNSRRWIYTNKSTGEFNPLSIDSVICTKKPPRPKYVIKVPYRIPKKDGDYFEKKLKLLDSLDSNYY